MEDKKLYYNIGEVAEMLKVNPSLLRYWEKEFPALKPRKNNHGTRYYTQEDIDLLKRIHYLTKTCGFTLEGTREQLQNGTRTARVGTQGGVGSEESMQLVETLQELRGFLVDLKKEL